MTTVRPYKERDRKDVLDVCYKTGYFGEDASPHFGDGFLFGLIFSSYYIDYEPENCFVAEADGAAVGYIIGTPDTIKQKGEYDRRIIPKVLGRMFTRTLFFHPGDVAFILGLRGYGRFEEELYAGDILERYPAHLHINLLPGHQRGGLGGRLIGAFEERMREKGARGIHLVTTDQNIKAVPFYRKNGYEIVRELPNILWERKSKPGTKALMFAKEL
jgi:ribosomal protein S18 acetylase RimI-like enzyme